ncbi:MAG: M1 family peptidase [Acidobacteria bacterium]|nr:M1 family peptidase [Acidobacteriota bacterium]
MPVRNPFLLPTNVVPSHYNIELKPDLGKFTFSGSEKITVQVKQTTRRIVLHSVDLKIARAQIVQKGSGAEQAAAKIRYDAKMEAAVIDFPKPLKKGAAVLALEFTGELNDKMHGFYRTAYTVNGEKHWGAATQFEATDARRAFPCWDEPAAKATFRIALDVPRHLTALSNMPIVAESPAGEGRKRVQYDTTPIMSTYLVAIVVAELECIEGKDSKGVPIRIWTSLGKKEQGRFALDQSTHTLAYFADWFGIPYAFPKLDQVALPDFASGAMENWGLVTYRETALLVDPVNSSQAARLRVASVVDHELAHQWFGNYTTMDWWTDLWLNEGFASYMGPKATDHCHPSWETWMTFVHDEYVAALHEDSLRNTHPVEVQVKNPHEIREVFDAISYSKGSVVNRMVEHYLGEESFRKGLNRYLSVNAFGNAATMDLWSALEKVSGKPIKKMMAGYTRQPGYPVLMVKSQRKKVGGHNLLQLDLEQKRFFIDGSRDSKKTLWQIPVGVQVGSPAGAKGEPTYETMTKRTHRMTVEANEGEWVKINPRQSGFYRTAYPDEMLDHLITAVVEKQLPAVDRLCLLDDAFALARAGVVRSSSALRVLEAYRFETDFSVWLTVAGVFGSLDNQLSREKFHLKLTAAAREFFAPIAFEMGWERRPQDGHLDMMLRSMALRQLGAYGDAATIAEARKRFKKFLAGDPLDPDLRQPVYSLIAENGGAREWEQLRKLYRSTDLHEEKTRVLRACGNFRDKKILGEYLEFALSSEVRSQDTWLALANAASHPLGRGLAWRFLKKNWKTFVTRYHGGGLNLLNRCIAVCTGFTSKAELADAEKFLKSRRGPGMERAIDKSLEAIRSNVKWLERDRNDLRSYFS